MPCSVYITKDALVQIRRLPGHLRQQVKRSIDMLKDNPTPPQSKPLDFPDLYGTLYRLRLGNWRIIYIYAEAEKTIDIIAIRKRPPYDYGDLEKIMEGL